MSDERAPKVITGLGLYDRAASRSAAVVISEYSTSFSMAAKLLAPSVRRNVANIYALVRLADEVVDGPAAAAGLSVAQTEALLDTLEAETEAAIESGYSTNLVVHAFACTARSVGFGAELTAPFFASMRSDLTETVHTEQSVAEYIYGSAEVVGLMCLRAFTASVPADRYTPAQLARLDEGARHLGAAFQKINFLRDLAADVDGLGRNYFPGVDPRALTEADRTRILDDIDDDLANSAEIVGRLPRSARKAVWAAQLLFTALADRLRAAPVESLMTTRISVPLAAKLGILIKASTVGR